MIKKRGLSGVISVIVIIAVVMAAGVMVWNFVENMVSDRMEGTEACYEAGDKVSINNDFTCYEKVNGSLRVSVSVGDIALDAIIISVTGEGGSKTATIGSSAKTFADVMNYPSRGGSVIVPGRNSGKTYLITGLDEVSRDSMRISISPMVNGEQCDTVDTMNNVYACSTFS